MKWNEKETEQYFKPLRDGVLLSVREKNEIRDQLETRIAHTTPIRLTPSPLTTFFNPFFHPVPALTLLLVIAVTTSTAAAAEGTLPGDFLYPIKVHVNEEVRAAFNTTPEQKASWELTRAERRIEEATVLAAENRLDEPTRKRLDTQVETHVDYALALAPLPDSQTTPVMITLQVKQTLEEERIDTGSNKINENEVKVEAQENVPDNVSLTGDRASKEERIAIKARAEATRIARNRLLRRAIVKTDTSMKENALGGASEEREEIRTLASTRDVPETLATREDDVSHDTRLKEVAKDPRTSGGSTETTPASQTGTRIMAALSAQDSEMFILESARLKGESDALAKRLETAERTLGYAEVVLGATEIRSLRDSLDTAHSLQDEMIEFIKNNDLQTAADLLKDATEITFKVIEDAQDLLDTNRRKQETEDDHENILENETEDGHEETSGDRRGSSSGTSSEFDTTETRR